MEDTDLAIIRLTIDITTIIHLLSCLPTPITVTVRSIIRIIIITLTNLNALGHLDIT